MAVPFAARVNLRVTQETYDAYAEAAQLLGLDTTALVRQFVEANVPAVEAIAQTARAAQAGRIGQGTGLLVKLMESAVAQGQLGIAQARVLQSEAEELERKKVAGG